MNDEAVLNANVNLRHDQSREHIGLGYSPEVTLNIGSAQKTFSAGENSTLECSTGDIFLAKRILCIVKKLRLKTVIYRQARGKIERKGVN